MDRQLLLNNYKEFNNYTDSSTICTNANQNEIYSDVWRMPTQNKLSYLLQR